MITWDMEPPKLEKQLSIAQDNIDNCNVED